MTGSDVFSRIGKFAAIAVFAAFFVMFSFPDASAVGGTISDQASCEAVGGTEAKETTRYLDRAETTGSLAIKAMTTSQAETETTNSGAVLAMIPLMQETETIGHTETKEMIQSTAEPETTGLEPKSVMI